MDILQEHGIGIGGSNIKSIQRGIATVAVGNSGVDVTISSVDTSKSIIKIWGVSNTDNNDSTSCAFCEISTSETIHLAFYSTVSYIASISWVVIEYNNVKSLQKGSCAPTGSEQIITISNVNAAKSDLVYSYNSSLASNNIGVIPICRFISDTSIGINASGSTVHVYWQVIEFN